jgi:nucleoid DNA-binding protein
MADNNASRGGKAMTKSAVYTEIANSTKLSRKQVAEVFDALSKIIRNQLGKKGPGVFTLPGLIKMKLVRKKATPARQGINPFTKQPQMFKAKPARNIVRARPLKTLNEMVK